MNTKLTLRLDEDLIVAAKRHAATSGFSDYEDAVVHEAARDWRADVIVTRDTTGFRRSSLPVVGADELCSALMAADV